MPKKSVHLETLQKLQTALKDFDMSFSTSNKLLRMAIVSEIIDTIGLFEQLVVAWSTDLPFGSGPDEDVDFAYWGDMNNWSDLMSKSKQNVCIDDLSFSLGNGKQTDDISKMKKATYIKHFTSILKNARYDGKDSTIDFLKFLSKDKTGTTSFGNIVFHALNVLTSTIRKAESTLKTPTNEALMSYYDTQQIRLKPYIEEYQHKVKNIVNDTIPTKRKENSLRALKDEIRGQENIKCFLSGIKTSFNQYDIADYRSNNTGTNISDDEILEELALTDLFVESFCPHKIKVAKYIFENRKKMSDEVIASFFIYAIVTPNINSQITEYKVPNSKPKIVQQTTDSGIPTAQSVSQVHYHIEKVEQLTMGDNVQNKIVNSNE